MASNSRGRRRAWLLRVRTARRACRDSRHARAESSRHGDLLLLQNASEGCTGAGFTKHFEWWRWASRLPPTVTHVAKTEDDVMLHIPNLLVDLRGLQAVSYLYYGSFAYSGVDLFGLKVCGFSWSGARNYEEYGCRSHSYRPFPFASGPLELLSSELVRSIAWCADIHRFVYDAAAHISGLRTDEDVLLGLWVSHLAGTLARHSRVTYANIDTEDDPHRFHDLACEGDRGDQGSLYQAPSQSALVVHRIKTPALMRYVWRVLRQCAKHNVRMCFAHERSTSPLPSPPWLVPPSAPPLPRHAVLGESTPSTTEEQRRPTSIDPPASSDLLVSVVAPHADATSSDHMQSKGIAEPDAMVQSGSLRRSKRVARAERGSSAV